MLTLYICQNCAGSCLRSSSAGNPSHARQNFHLGLHNAGRMLSAAAIGSEKCKQRPLEELCPMVHIRTHKDIVQAHHWRRVTAMLILQPGTSTTCHPKPLACSTRTHMSHDGADCLKTCTSHLLCPWHLNSSACCLISVNQR